ncbi:MAG: hypothetical protein LRZ94_01310, partial [Candidatus Pacebacteria bacterium]|nr:hypothetical protein [Candidatus Paceibacterota bacterium]
MSYERPLDLQKRITLEDLQAEINTLREHLLTHNHLDIGNAQLLSGVVKGDLKSGNFKAGSAGWRIQQSGVAEFQDIVARGTISGRSTDTIAAAINSAGQATDIVDLSITETKLANLAVATGKIKDEAIIASKIWRGGAVITLSAQIGTGIIQTAHIGDLQVKRGNIDNLAVNDAKISDLKVEKLTGTTLTGKTVQTALTGRRIRISSATGLTDRVSFLDGNTEEGYLRLEQAGFNWEMSIGGLNGDMFTVGTSVAAGAPIYVSMPFFGGAGTGATGQADISGGSGNNARAIGLSWSGGGAPIFRLDLSGRGITRIGNSLIPQWNDDLG